MFFNGMQIIEDSNLIEQYRFPRSKRKRIRKKWEKDKGRNFAPDSNVYQVAGRMICHPDTAYQLKSMI